MKDYKAINEGIIDAFKYGMRSVGLNKRIKKADEEFNRSLNDTLRELHNTKDPFKRHMLQHDLMASSPSRQIRMEYNDLGEKIRKGAEQGDAITKFQLRSAETLGKAYGHVKDAAEEHPYLAATTAALAAGAGALGLRKLLKRRQQNKQINQ